MLVFKGVQPNGKPILSDHQTRDVFMDFFDSERLHPGSMDRLTLGKLGRPLSFSKSCNIYSMS